MKRRVLVWIREDGYGVEVHGGFEEVCFVHSLSVPLNGGATQPTMTSNCRAAFHIYLSNGVVAARMPLRNAFRRVIAGTIEVKWIKLCFSHCKMLLP